MQPLIIPATDNTPGIWFEPATGTFELTGCSIPENASEFYQPVIEWLANHLGDLTEDPTLRVRLNYFNSTSLKAIYMVLKQVKDANTMGRHITVEWYIEEDDELLVETQAMLSEMLGLEMVVVPADDKGERKAS